MPLAQIRIKKPMKTIALALSILFLAKSLNAGLVVVQEEEQISSGHTQKATVTLKIEGNKFRADRNLPQFAISSINDCATGTGLMLQHHSKSYTEASASQAKEGLEHSITRMKEMGMIPEKRPQLQATGKKRTINEWKAQEYIAETESLKSTYWIANELASLKKYFSVLQNCFGEELNKQFPDLQL